RIAVEELNVRSGPGTNYPIVRTVSAPSVYTIVEVNGYWGKLKSGAGWINLQYTNVYVKEG
nr:SH3 domain-containing protein [Lachnospiraceae bacterium]